ncbi:MAG: Asp-tRNA(Asn)/Glu-tRNA(Gln) amidotransferase subunit GatC [Gammaproteobacteria bacterium]|nr:Asp-tRNA(Asn)/Glu-tRNA(Gln) amidotransferase subunit GatC [Gammaproteobacteria bacterium]
MAIDAEQVRRIAHLARIGLAADEADRYIGDLESILTMVERMHGVTTAGVAPLAHPIDVGQPLRPDRVTETDQRDAYQADAPAVANGFYLVPRVVE